MLNVLQLQQVWPAGFSLSVPVCLYTFQYDCTHTNMTVHIPIWLHLPVRLYTYQYNCIHTSMTVHIPLWLYTYQYDCAHTNMTTHTNMTVPIPVWLYTYQYDCTPTNMTVPLLWLYPYQSDCTHTSMIVHIPIWLYPYQYNCTHTNMTVPIPIWLYTWLYKPRSLSLPLLISLSVLSATVLTTVVAMLVPFCAVLLLSCVTQCFCEAIQAQTRGIQEIFIILLFDFFQCMHFIKKITLLKLL